MRKADTPQTFALLIGVTALYVAAAKAGLMYAIVGGTVSLVWAPSGIALAAILVLGWRMAFAVALGAFFANVGTGIPLLAACSIAAGNTLEAVAGAGLLLRFPGFEIGLKTRRDVFALILCAAVLSTTLSASVGMATLAGAGTIASQDYATVWLKWWLGDMIGVLVVAPPLLLATRVALRAPSPRELAEALCLVTILVIVSVKIFGAPELEAGRYYVAPLAVFPFLIWASLRFGQVGASLVTLVFSLVAVWGASRGTGPFMAGKSLPDLVQWSAFMIVVAVTGLVLAASVAGQQRAQAELRSYLEKLEHHIAVRTRDLVAINADLHKEMAERRNLEIALIRVSEEQRRAIGSELHDGLGQHLTSLSLLCAGLRQRLVGVAQSEAGAVLRIEELIDEAAAMNRSAARGLYPVAMEHGGLIAALERLAEDVNLLKAMKCLVRVDPDVQVNDPLVAINLYRIAQEAVNNAVKYSQARLMVIELLRVDGEHRLTLRDDGIGLGAGAARVDSGMGMYSMRYRASLLGGSLQVTDNVPRGTTIAVTYRDLESQLEQPQHA
jgi:two-component system, NarL family, sensor histidine kinase FusK